MEEDQSVISSGQVISPETVTSRSFTSAFRGYHPGEVRQFLQRVSHELAAGAEREVELRRALQEALARAAHPELDEATLTSVLGEHAARLLASARDTAASITAEAQKQADDMVRQTEAIVARMHGEAEGLLARRVAEADATAATIRQAAETHAQAVREEAKAEADAVIESAKRQGRDMVAEARDLRERMLGDLSRRRRSAQVQLDQLRAASDRLLSAYDVVRRTLEEATAELEAAEPEARTAAEAVARRSEGAETAPAVPRVELPPLDLPPVARERERPMALVAGRASTGGRDQALLSAPAPPRHRRAEEVPPPPARPPLRPQTVVDSVAARMPSSPTAVTPTVTPGAPEPPAPRQPPAPPEPAPEPVSELGTGEVPVVTPDGPAAPGDSEGDVGELFARIRAGRSDTEAQAPSGEPGPEPEPAPAPSSLPVLDPISGENALEGRDALLENVEAGLTRALKRVLQDEQNEVLDRLRRLREPSSAEVLPDASAQRAAYRDAALPWLLQAARAGVGFVSDPAPGSGAESDHPSLGAQAAALAAELVQPLRERLARALDDAADAGDPSVVDESLRTTYRQCKVQQVEAIARHHVVAAFSVGAFAATLETAQLQWLVENDGHCPDCDDNALAGPTAKGEPFPTGQLHPPAHPGCRCLLVPVPPVPVAT